MGFRTGDRECPFIYHLQPGPHYGGKETTQSEKSGSRRV